MYDDAAKVNNAFEKEKQNNPTSTKIKTHLAKPNASGETTLRSYQATKGGRTSDNPSSTIKQTQRRRKKQERIWEKRCLLMNTGNSLLMKILN